MITTTTDPVTGYEIMNPAAKPYVIEGCGRLSIRIYFESEQSRRAYLSSVTDDTGSTSPQETG